MKHICRNCHFLSKSHPLRDGRSYVTSWNENERTKSFIEEHYSPNCSFGVWDAGIDPSLSKKLNILIDEDRKNSCFFIENHPGMSFQAAKILQERRAQNSELKRSNLNTQIGLWIAALALLANLLVAIFK